LQQCRRVLLVSCDRLEDVKVEFAEAVVGRGGGGGFEVVEVECAVDVGEDEADLQGREEGTLLREEGEEELCREYESVKVERKGIERERSD
jgi:hypothetical protein